MVFDERPHEETAHVTAVVPVSGCFWSPRFLSFDLIIFDPLPIPDQRPADIAVSELACPAGIPHRLSRSQPLRSPRTPSTSDVRKECGIWWNDLSFLQEVSKR